MLTKFEVTNFKNFNTKCTLDLTKTNMYEFNKECVVNGIVNKALIYGPNAIGKSNLGFAIFDLISHLTDKNSGSRVYSNYLNAVNGCTIAKFRYEFSFDGTPVVYEYGKEDLETLVYEKIFINNAEYASIDRRKSTEASISAKGAESLNRNLGESKVSIISYLKKNSVLSDNMDNKCFLKFVSFVNGMLFFRSLDDNNYIGLEQGSSAIGADILKKNNLEDFQTFLNKAGIQCKLKAIDEGDKQGLAFDFGDKVIPFYEIASQGTKSLSLFYFWLQRIKEDSKVNFLFIDEYDAFYHHSLSSLIIEILNKFKSQTIITTHNTSVMTNDLLRPDCYFVMNENGIHSLANKTKKELRVAHNIEKMYRSGSFDE